MQGRAEVLRRFADRLEQVRLAAGNPPYADLARRSRWLKTSTISDVLRAQSNPSLDFVVAFVQACRSFAESRSARTDPAMFDVDGWRNGWLELQRRLGVLRRQTGSVARDSGRGSSGRTPLPVPRQLPAAPHPFIGREPYLEALRGARAQMSTSVAGRTAAMAVDGAAGIGKTALVICWAHQVREYYPDGDLYLDLRGYGPAGSPLPPADALRLLLQALKTPVALLPEDADQLSALWRSLLAERRLLVVLDNARSAAQVRPLLPGTGGSTVVVTSRYRLGGLLVRDGVTAFSLAAMTSTESDSLLRATIGDLVLAEPAAAAQLAIRCGHHPLALRILAERLAGHPRPLAEVLRELSTGRPLDALATADRDQPAAVRSVLDWSYRALPEPAARLFRLLSAHPGPQLCVAAAAALAGVPPALAVRDLTALANIHLLQEVGPARYQMHDLVRDRSAELLAETESAGERTAAMRRELLWYLHSAVAADRVLMPGRRNVVRQPPPDFLAPAQFASYGSALQWCDAELDNLIGLVRQAIEQRWYEIAWQLPTTMLSYFNLRKSWTTWITCFELAATAARELADRFAEAMCANALGIAHREIGHAGTALEYFGAAVTIFHDLGVAGGESTALSNIGTTYQEYDHERALVVFRRALAVARSGGAPVLAELTALHNLGESYLALGGFGDALGCAARCLEISERAGDRAGVGFALTSFGEIYARQHRWQDAICQLRAAVPVRAEVGDLQGVAVAMFRLGRALAGSGDHVLARDRLRQAREIFERLGDPLAAEVRAFQRRLP